MDPRSGQGGVMFLVFVYPAGKSERDCLSEEKRRDSSRMRCATRMGWEICFFLRFVMGWREGGRSAFRGLDAWESTKNELPKWHFGITLLVMVLKIDSTSMSNLALHLED